MTPWISVADRLPPEGEVVETKIMRITPYRRPRRFLWTSRGWRHPDGWIQAATPPTHWRPVRAEGRKP